jgi:hypothetical protein
VLKACDVEVLPESVGDRRKAPFGERGLEGSVLLDDRGGAAGPDPGSTGDPVRGVAPKGDEVRHLLGIHAVALAHLVRPHALQLGHAALRMEDRGSLRRELEKVTVVREDEHRSIALLLGVHSGCEEVVRFVPGCLRPRKAERLDQLRQAVELIGQVTRKIAPGLVLGQKLVAVRRDGEGVECDENSSRFLGLPRPDEHVGEPDDHVRRLAFSVLDRARKGVIRAMREVVPVDGE